MAACTFYQNVLRASTANDSIKMTQNHLIMRNLSKMKKLTTCVMVN